MKLNTIVFFVDLQLLSMTATAVSTVPICLYSGGCAVASDCVKGAMCQILNSYYSQCIPDPNYSKNNNCVADYQQCGGTVPYS